MSGFPVDSMGLAGILVHVGVHELDDVVSDGGGEDCGHGDAVGHLGGVFLLVDAHYWSGGHLVNIRY